MRVLMCPWTFPKVEWAINPHMNINNQPDPEKARLEWLMLLECYLQLGITVELLAPDPHLHDMVYTANAGWGKKGVFLLSRFKHKERKKETPLYKQWFISHGFQVIKAKEYFEGQGDLITTNSAHLLGHGTRTSPHFITELKQVFSFGKPIISLELVDPAFYHLDTCLFSWKPMNIIMYYPEAFSKESLLKLRQLPLTRIEVTREEALNFVCNSVYHEKTALVSGASDRLLKLFWKMDCLTTTVASVQEITTLFTYLKKDRDVPMVISLPTPTELMKGGGSYRCCSLFLD